jgi:hypothetical protein
MATRLHIVDPPEGEHVTQGTMMDDPGAMWRWPDLDRDGREAWVIVLPNRAGIWWTTYIADDDPDGGSTGRMWEVTGEPPNITVSPSINAGDGPGPGNWHGWIKDGVMTP